MNKQNKNGLIDTENRLMVVRGKMDWWGGDEIKTYKLGPGWCGSVLDCKLKGHWFNSQSGHMPGFWARCPVGDTQEATTN